MGEVFRARDTRLGREVAVKVLSERLAGDPAALARFTREARLVAALSHPNLCALLDVGDENGTAYVVMELLEGETLAARLKRGAIGPRAAIEVGASVALGLAAAHDKGIVHRDLKPENVFLLRDGRVKVLDFGLARPTLGSLFQRVDDKTDALTREGLVVGTVGYMSPEQVEGAAMDHRSDVFSFGCVLYETLAGARAFDRSSPVATMTAILEAEPVPLHQLSPALPSSLVRAVERCLEKRPERRFQSAHDLAFALESAGEALSAAPTVSAPAVAGRRSGRGLRVLASAAVLLLSALGLAWLGRGPKGEAGPATRRFSQLTDLPGIEQSPRLSPDGKSLVFVGRVAGNADVHVQRVGGHNPINLTKECGKDDTGPTFSPDGGLIAFRSECEGGGIFVMGATGESRRRVTPSGYDPTFSPDGRSVAVASEPTLSPMSRFSPLSRVTVVDLASGSRRDLTEQDGMEPAWSPHGHRIAFWGLRGTSNRTGQRDLFTVPAQGGPPVAVTEDAAVDWAPAWSPDGRFLYFASDRGGTMNVWRVAIEETSGRVLGKPEPVTVPALWAGWPSLSSNGLLAFAAQEERSVLHGIPFDPARGEPSGDPVTVLSGSRTISHVALSGDGITVAFTGGAVASQEKLYAIRADGTSYRQLLDDDFRNRVPRWSPDGSRLAFFSNRGGAYEIWTLGADGAGLARFASEPNVSLFYPSWSHDGRRLAANDYTTTRLYDVSSTGPSTALPPLGGGRAFFAVDWSPDGSRLAGFSVRQDGVPDGILTHDLASGTYERLSDDPGRWVLWLPDGKRLLYAASSGAMRVAGPAAGNVRELFPAGTLAGDVGSFDLSRDGRRLVYVTTNREADVWMSAPRGADRRPGM